MSVEQAVDTVKAVPLNNIDSSEEDSDEDAKQEVFVDSLNRLSILERLGPASDEMTEGEVESAFSQLTLAFRCDQYTLTQRLQAEEHARNKAEENLQLELQRGKEAIEALKTMCLDSKRYKILEKLDLTLDILGGTVEQVARTAELLGAAHQEAKVSRAVELMVAHVENLRQRHDRHCAELEETRKQISTSVSIDHGLPELRDEIEIRVRTHKEGKYNLRRRISSSVMTRESLCQEIKKPKEKESRNEVLSQEKVTEQQEDQHQDVEPKAPSPPKLEDVESAPLEESCRQPVSPAEGTLETVIPQTLSDVPPSTCPGPSTVCNHNDEVNPPIPNRPPSNRALRRRQRSKTELDGYSSRGKRERHDHSDHETPSATSQYRFPRIFIRQRLLVHWLNRCRWLLTCAYLTILLAIILMAIFFWFVRIPVLWM